MEDIEKKFDPLIVNYIKKYEERTAERQEQPKENEDFMNIFNQLIENVIRPEMYKFSQLLEKKGFLTSIIHESGHQPSISLSFSYKKSLNLFFSPLYPHLKIGMARVKSGLQMKKIFIYESKFDPYGLGCATLEGTYDLDQITRSFVKEKLSNFFKALFSNE